MVEYASTRLALVWLMAMNEHSMNVMPPTRTTMSEGAAASSPPCADMVPAYMTGASFTSKNTPAFTMVEECRSAEVGVGATMAPRSHVWKGICAAFVRPANASALTGSAASRRVLDADAQETPGRKACRTGWPSRRAPQGSRCRPRGS